MDFYSKHSSKEIAQSSYSSGLLYYFKQDMILCTGSCICKVSCLIWVLYLLCCISSWIDTTCWERLLCLKLYSIIRNGVETKPVSPINHKIPSCSVFALLNALDIACLSMAADACLSVYPECDKCLNGTR